jgi:hypothetical protein
MPVHPPDRDGRDQRPAERKPRRRPQRAPARPDGGEASTEDGESPEGEERHIDIIA